MDKVLRRLVLTAMLTALAVVLGIVVKFTPGLNLEFPNGGSVFGLYTLPLVVIGILLGYKHGILGGLVYGLVSWLLDGYFIHWVSIFLDYLVPFSLLGVAGAIFGKKVLDKWTYLVGAFTLAFFLRWISHGLSGVLFFAEYAPTDTNVWFYSFVLYNLPYVLSSTVISLVIALIIKKQLIELNKSFE